MQLKVYFKAQKSAFGAAESAFRNRKKMQFRATKSILQAGEKAFEGIKGSLPSGRFEFVRTKTAK